MPPKVKITKQDIIDTAVDIVRNSGEGALNARNIALRLSCSTQPIFSNFETMESLKFAVVEVADALFNKYINEEIEKGEYSPYKASGIAYIQFAQQEKELFKLLYMRNRDNENVPKESKLLNQMSDMVQSNIDVSKETANLFHLEMWSFVHGIATMLATGFLELDKELISRMTSDCYQGLKKHYEDKEQ